MNNLSIGFASAFLVALTGCGGPSYSYQGVTVAISPQVPSVQAGATQTFSTTTANAPNFPLWTLNGNIIASSAMTSAGAFSEPTTDAPSGTYTAPATPPVYTPAQISSGLTQGSVTLGVFIHSSTTNVFSTVSASTTFAIVGPISAGLFPATATVNLGSMLQFSPYVVGTLTNGYTLQVNGFAGGRADVGTISATGLYTAPTVMPVTGSTITVTVVSNADPTKTGTATITLH